MITRQQYLEARAQKKEAEQIIEQYERTELSEYLRSFEGLNKNDYVTYVGGSKGKNLTVGKQYRLTCSPWYGRIAVINDSGKRMVYRLKNRYFEV
ncbi:hypothetical protein [Carboxylicivirga marina]|uniref:DUF4258 domain-containing protein n=1 Tax=Carboxylicivirga marina TaxID=2800988 RepID=A0ABS1HG73_9BACT|nr:hypothetical protein [Carboxylicivirga marina]MBK3516666.1 hypothetical protein [Carboxylicivirga marina]